MQNIYWKTPTHRRAFIGDVVLLAIVTFIGFASHNEWTAGLRMLTTFVPMSVAWFWASPWFGLYDEAVLTDVRQVWWRALAAWTLAAPFGTFLRALLLNSTALPVFTLVIFSFHALGFALWRGIYAYRSGGAGG